MSADKLVFDLSQEIEGSPNVFIRKDWLNILDNQNQNYQNNQSIIDTSQLSNSNKWLGYREGYLLIPLVETLIGASGNNTAYSNATKLLGTGIWDGAYNSDFAMGLKNWYGQIIHSFTLDYNGTTIIQQTPFCQMWNTFKLLTTLSYNDILTQGPTIGFYPDDPGSFTFINSGGVLASPGTANNDINLYPIVLSDPDTNFNQNAGNTGFSKRMEWVNYNPAAGVNSTVSFVYGGNNNGATSLMYGDSASQLWKSFISSTSASNATHPGCIQITIMATVQLKHIHSFFNMCPLLKGVFMKMTMNLNNSSVGFNIAGGTDAARVLTLINAPQVPVGGVNPLMISGFYGDQEQGGISALPNGNYYADLSVGAVPLSNLISSNKGNLTIPTGKGSKSIYLYVPAYTFNPVFEQAYLSNPIKQIKYTDIYQYQVKGIGAGQQFNNLITNGIANIKSVLIIPFYSPGNATSDNTGLGVNGYGVPVYQSPFDTAGTGTTSPLCHFNNFNIQISGQNAIYNTQRYTFEQFNNQLYGQNAVNGGLTDGITSGLISYYDFQMSQCYYYVNVERMLPVEQSVPKAIQILGTNQSAKSVDLWVFVEYGVEVNIDSITGARV